MTTAVAQLGIPRWAIVMAALAAAFVGLPLVAMLGRAELSQLPAQLTSASAREALWLSLRTATAATLLCIVLGTPLALVLARIAGGWWLTALRALVLIPLVLPPVVGGLALLYTFGRRGLIGHYLEIAGISVAFSTTAVVLAQTFVSLPFLVLGLEGALRSVGERYDAAAACLGARPGVVFTRVTLPLIRPALVTASILAFARSLGEFGATLTFAGSLQGVTRTLPLEIFLRRETDPAGAVALALVLVFVAAAVIAVARPTRSW